MKARLYPGFPPPPKTDRYRLEFDLRVTGDFSVSADNEFASARLRGDYRHFEPAILKTYRRLIPDNDRDSIRW